MDLVEKVLTLVHSSIETKAQFGEAIAPFVVTASEKIVHTFVNDGKILLCGNGNCSINAQHFATCLLNQGEQERPALPAIILDANSAVSGISQSYGHSEIYSRQIKALGQEQDILIIYTITGEPQNLINAVQTAHDRNMPIIAITGNDGGYIGQLLDGNDLEIRVPIESIYKIHEIHLMITFILCQLIDEQLFGENL